MYRSRKLFFRASTLCLFTLMQAVDPSTAMMQVSSTHRRRQAGEVRLPFPALSKSPTLSEQCRVTVILTSTRDDSSRCLA
ncbi:hypothetical protein CTAM01_14028 [Colletotrichum tamarilloi]|uniref:Secreted protein n=1 Tax=Colletotrichum tamarilloi TaxID=1209934 RepID=A0ABQ9QQE2_9PEZI|nr:uncharacterized protein CTAM01_14028 [Colletotrichum tamarilloi]KAI3546561.1 hypothetical protein CSPX01_04216 [Colletotrichum filicis]KAK1481104.1 hypothetical protein CTAM01_14028 [Colletotrichum tamarilloi]